MSEKRFIRNIVGDIYDSENDKWFEEDWEGKPIDYDDDLVDELNKLDFENKRLREENERLHQKNTKLIAKIDFLEKIIDGDL